MEKTFSKGVGLSLDDLKLDPNSSKQKLSCFDIYQCSYLNQLSIDAARKLTIKKLVSVPMQIKQRYSDNCS